MNLIDVSLQRAAGLKAEMQRWRNSSYDLLGSALTVQNLVRKSMMFMTE